MKKLIILFSVMLFISCKNEKEVQTTLPVSESSTTHLKYAKGFSIENQGDITLLTITYPWPNADKTYTYALIDRKIAPKITLMRDQYDGIIITPVESMVVTSTTHIAALELLDIEEKLIGFPGTKYVSSAETRERIDSGVVRELGKNESINTEVLLELQPEIVVAFGIDGTNKAFNTIQKANIPVIYNGDWTEGSPLAKAEWIKLFGVLSNKTQEADSTFNSIEKAYNEAKILALKVEKKPTVLSGAMHKDVWYLPNGNSSEAQFLRDANTNYLWSNTTGSGSLALNFENVLEKAQDAEFWLNPSYYTSFEQLQKANPHYTNFEAFSTKNIYSFSMTTGKTGGVLYYELGLARPDLVLKDIIKICHPELLQNYETTFFKQLQ